MSRGVLVLASASPRRRRLLALAGLDFEVVPAEVDESPRPDEGAADQVRRLAQAKAEQVGQSRPADWILAADTLVVLGSLVLGKPRDRAEAAEMLARLSGRTHQVLTGYCLFNKALDRGHIDLCRTEVEFRNLTGPDIEKYLESGEPLGKAGAYAIQGRGAGLVKRVFGSYTNVVGLPLAEIIELLRFYQVID